MNEYESNLAEALAQGDFRAAWGAFAARKLDQKQAERMFVDAGAYLAGYERDGGEESDLRAVAFCEANMQALAAHMQNIDDFQWWNELEGFLDELLAGNAMREDNKLACRAHFIQLIESRLRAAFPQIYERSVLSEIRGEVLGIDRMLERMGPQVERLLQLEENLRERLRECEDERQRPRQEHSEHEQAVSDSMDFAIPKWRLRHLHIEGIFKPQTEQEAEIHSLIEAWESERGAFPGWYILPVSVCRELADKTQERGLLQNDRRIDLRTMLLFAYELVWRWEKCMHPYIAYETKHIRNIWNQYAAVVRGKSGEELCAEPTNADVRKWFYIGQALLRIFRENGEDAEWKSVYRFLKDYEAFGINGREELQLEKAKYAFHHLDIPALRRELDNCSPKRTQYELRLQLLGMRVECGGVRNAVVGLRELRADIEEALQGEMADDYRVFCQTLHACTLQLVSMCMQGISDYEETYELHQEEINRILEEAGARRSLFDWDAWCAHVKEALLVWHVKKYEASEPFELNRETIVLIGSANYCEEAYRYYRVIERLALPLQCGYVCLAGQIESAWMEALLEINTRLGIFMLARSEQSKTIKTLVDRAYVASLDPESLAGLIEFLIGALGCNMDEMNNLDRDMTGCLIVHILENVPQLLIRFMSRCPERPQKKALLLVKTLMEDEELPVRFPMAELMVGVLGQVSERKKAQMLGEMLETKICEHRTLYGRGDGFDLFSCYFRKEELGPLRAYCVVEPETIAWLLQNPSDFEDGDATYEWRAKVTRLETLDQLALLSEEQRTDYAKLLWSRVGKNGLPDLPDMHLFAYENLPGADAQIPVQSVKGYFLHQRLCDQFSDKEGCSFTMGNIPYLEELVLLCRHAGRGYWSKEEAKCLLENILDYWRILKAKMEAAMPDTDVQSEYRRRGSVMLQAAAAVCRNVTALPDDAVMDSVKSMTEEMKSCEISTKELEVCLKVDQTLAAEIMEEIRLDDNSFVVGALSAACQHMLMQPSGEEAQQLFDAVLAVLQYRKMPGLSSAVWVLHNLVYEKSPILNEGRLSAIDCCLEELAEVIQPANGAGVRRMKDILCIRRACAALAFRMYHWDACENGRGVLLWRELTACDESNEVKNEWVW